MKVIATNKKAYHDYEIIETYEAGIELKGTEIKSVRNHAVNLKDSFAKVENGEVWLYNMHISPYDYGNIHNHDPRRKRRLLLKKREINRLAGLTSRGGYTLIPLKMYLKGKWAKIELAVAKGKKKYDKRQAIKEREVRRELDRALKEFRR